MKTMKFLILGLLASVVVMQPFSGTEPVRSARRASR